MEKVKFLPLEGLLEMQENGENFKLIEVLSEDNFKKGHISRAINIPVDKLNEESLKNINKSEKIVVYCASYSCHASTNAARILARLGYKNVLDFKGGKQVWSSAGLELEK